MNSRDLSFSLAAGIITAVFLYPTLKTTDLYTKLPFPIILLIAFPIISVISMTVVTQIAKRIPILWQAAKFGQIGVLNTAIDFGILNFFIGFTNITSGRGIIAINIASFTAALINSYFWNKNWVFGGAKKSSFLTFVFVTLIGLSINTGIVYTLTTFVEPMVVESETLWANVAKALATGLSMVWNFLGYRLVVFRKSASKK